MLVTSPISEVIDNTKREATGYSLDHGIILMQE